MYFLVVAVVTGGMMATTGRKGADAAVNWAPAGNDKAEAFLKYARLYPEYNFIFFGDNGQGDLYAGEIYPNPNPKPNLNSNHGLNPNPNPSPNLYTGETMVDKASVRTYVQDADKSGRCPVKAILIHDVKEKGVSVKVNMLTHGIITGHFDAMHKSAKPDSIWKQTHDYMVKAAEEQMKSSASSRAKASVGYVSQLAATPEETKANMQMKLDRGPSKKDCGKLLILIQEAHETWPEDFPFREHDHQGVEALLELGVVLGGAEYVPGMEYGRLSEKKKKRLEQWWSNNHIIFFADYPQAALALFRLGQEEDHVVHFPLEELRWTVQCAREDLLALKYKYIDRHRGKWGYDKWEAWAEKFNVSVREMNDIPYIAVEEAEIEADAAQQGLENCQKYRSGQKATKIAQDALDVATLKLKEMEKQLELYMKVKPLVVTELGKFPKGLPKMAAQGRSNSFEKLIAQGQSSNSNSPHSESPVVTPLVDGQLLNACLRQLDEVATATDNLIHNRRTSES